MKYIRITTDQGSVYLDKKSKKVYDFYEQMPPASWEYLLDLVYTAAFVLSPVYLHSVSIRTYVELLFAITVVLIVCQYLAGRRQDRFFDNLRETEFTYKPNFYCQVILKAFKKQIFKSTWASLFIIFFGTFCEVGTYWMISRGEEWTYIRLLGVLCPIPGIIIYLLNLRPISVTAEYFRYRRWVKNHGLLNRHDRR